MKEKLVTRRTYDRGGTEISRGSQTIARRGYGWIVLCYGDGWSGGLWFIESGVPYDSILGRSVFRTRADARKAMKAHQNTRALSGPIKVNIALTLVKP